MSIVTGKYTYVDGGKIEVINPDKYKVIIGNFCSIASGCKIFLNANHRKDWVTTYPFGHIHQRIFTNFNGYGHPTCNGNVVIGNDVWISSNVTIMSGVTIGDGAIIANNSHVVKDVEPYTLVGGNPAKYISSRFDDETIKKLLKIKWWNWDDEKINQYLPLLCSSNIQKLIKTFD
jgi:acetyltransferase-like isoleucine patch superfamily enzyme